jgi:hypothetical protein
VWWLATGTRTSSCSSLSTFLITLPEDNNMLAHFRKSTDRLFSLRSRRRPYIRRTEQRFRLALEPLETRLVLSNMGTLHLTDSTATIVEETHYAAKTAVYAYGNDLVDGYYDVEVVAPGGKSDGSDAILGLSDPNAPVQVSGGHFSLVGFPSGPISPSTVTGPRGNAFNVWDVVFSTGSTTGNPQSGSQGYDDTPNPGGEYQVVIAQHIDGETQDNFSQFTGNNDVTKSKNFKVEQQAPAPTSIVTNFTLTQPDGSLVTGPNPGGTTAAVGSTAQDFATVTVTTSGGGPVNEGTVDFQLYGPNGLIDDSEAPVDGNGMATDPFVSAPLVPGSYYFVAGYSDVGGSDFGESQSDSEPFTILQASPTLVTTATPNGLFALPTTVAPTLTDSAVLSGGYNPTGTITFSLYYNGGSTAVDTETVPVSGNGTYTTPMGYTLPTDVTVTGSYVWTASYTGDSNNGMASDDGTSLAEQVQVGRPNASSFTTSASPAITLGTSAPTITDTATLSGDYFPTGTITFTLTLNGNAVPAATQTDTVNGNGMYGASYALPTTGTVTGTYQWHATYTSGNGNNNSATDQQGTAEQTVVSPATPAIRTTPGATVTAGTSVYMTDTAYLSGGYFPGGTLTFTLYAPNGTTVAYTTNVTVTGNSTYVTSPGFLPSTNPSVNPPGTYQWVVSYSGDGNNNKVTSNKGDEPEVLVTASTATPKTLGFWGNSNGQAVLKAHDPAWRTLVNGLSLRNASGALFTVSTTASFASAYSTFASWLSGANATNMAYMLSAQLVTMELNVAYEGVNANENLFIGPTSVINTWSNNNQGSHLMGNLNSGANTYGQTGTDSNGFITIGSVEADAIYMLTHYANTTASGSARTFEESLKIVLDAANNDLAIYAS